MREWALLPQNGAEVGMRSSSVTCDSETNMQHTHTRPRVHQMLTRKGEQGGGFICDQSDGVSCSKDCRVQLERGGPHSVTCFLILNTSLTLERSLCLWSQESWKRSLLYPVYTTQEAPASSRPLKQLLLKATVPLASRTRRDKVLVLAALQGKVEATTLYLSQNKTEPTQSLERDLPKQITGLGSALFPETLLTDDLSLVF